MTTFFTTIPPDMPVDLAFQDALDYAVKRGRFLAGHDLVDYSRPTMVAATKPELKHENNLCLNGEGLAGLKRDAVLLALRESGGRVGKACQRLKVARSTYYDLVKRLVVVAGAVVVTGCAAVQYSPVPVATVPPLPGQDFQRAMSRAKMTATVSKPKTNGVITATWTPGSPPETVIVNQTTGQSYDAATAKTLTIGGLTVGATNTFVATNTAGASNPVSVLIQPDTNLLTYVESTYRWRWNGPAGILQTTSNILIWTDVGPIASGSDLVFTNVGKQRFYRVKIN